MHDIYIINLGIQGQTYQCWLILLEMIPTVLPADNRQIIMVLRVGLCKSSVKSSVK